jgi:hypothetical protein
MYAMPNCRVDVHAALVEDADGDTVQATDDVTPRLRAVPMSILERTKRTFSPATLTPQTIRVTTGRCDRTYDIHSEDMLHDTTHDRWYAIVTQTAGDSAVLAGELVLELQRTTR